ncbi:hypothetical protein RRG08_030071 [Elysia crispata]|uniref:Aldehyde oxidase/xanthine dehydrogenase a/b hammerhead domain-containing protein n=1 Tax=Elysia crispata TaxID=231223 RepID=A0AAE1D076_9GAST|nr:hypothetical protein RRG08_030071 [Elysia crispata]
MTAHLQATGEAMFTGDLPELKRELRAAFVLSTIGVGEIVQVDTSEALKLPGVVGFIGAGDIPPGGENNFIPANYHLYEPDWKDELFVTKDIDYAGRPIGLILAESQALAEQGARAVTVTYKNVQRPVMDLREAIQKNMIFEKATEQKIVGNAEAALKEAAYVVEGECEMGNQYYFYIENQVALSVPSEDGIDVYSATQCSEMAQRSVAQLLGKPMNYCNMIVSRLGGGFGGKFLHSCAVAAASAVAAEVTGRPVRLRVDLSTDMQFNGKRFPIVAKYKAGCDSEGKLLGVIVDIFVDAGHVATTMTFDVISMLDQGYYCPNWKVTMKQFKTNKVCAGPTRGPGQVPACLMIETILEHLAMEARQCPVIFRELNLFVEGQKNLFGTPQRQCTLKKLWQRLKQMADVQSRLDDISKYNKDNLWRKRGLSMTASRYDMCYYPTGFPTHVSVFAADGTVVVITAGVEMGQGLYMKVAQAVAYSLGVPLEFVKVRPNQNNVTPNPLWTGGSISSERCVASAMIACEKIKAQLQPFREKQPDADWKTLLQAAWEGNAVLSAGGTHHYDNPQVDLYATYMAGVVETEVDVLTGQYQVNRVDLLGDFGDSMNPTIDIGQVEGAYVMGLGAYLTEDIFFSKETGKLLNGGTWDYKPPTTKDIPIDWRIHFLPDSPNSVGVLSSKAAGEPPIGLAMGALLSVKKAVESVREDLSGKKTFLPVAAPFTVEKAQLASGIQVNHLHV